MELNLRDLPGITTASEAKLESDKNNPTIVSNKLVVVMMKIRNVAANGLYTLSVDASDNILINNLIELGYIVERVGNILNISWADGDDLGGEGEG